MKRIIIITLISVLLLSGVSLLPTVTGAWADDADLVPTLKSTAPVDPLLLQNVVRTSSATGAPLTVSVDSSCFPTIKLSVIVKDANGMYIHDLTANDFTVTEQSSTEGVPVAETIDSVTEVFEDDGVTPADEGVSLGFVFDLSGSIEQGWLIQAKQVATCLLQNMRSIDRVMLMSFSTPDSILEILPPGSATVDADANGTSDYIDALNDLSILGSSTAVYDAMTEAITDMSGESQPKAILLFTDGLTNNDRAYDINDVIQRATNAGVPVFTVNFGDPQQNLQDLAAGTGGVTLNSPTCPDLLNIYNNLAVSMPSTYSIIYTTHNAEEDGTTRTVALAYGGANGQVTFAAPSGQGPVACTKNCDGGTGCFVDTAVGNGTRGPLAILLGLFLVLAAGGLMVSLFNRLSGKSIIGILMAIILLAAPMITVDSARAGLRKGALSISPMGGIYYFDDDQEIEKGPVAGLGLGYQFADNLTAELMLNYGRFDLHYLNAAGCYCDTQDTNVGLARLDLLYHLWPDNDLTPYLAVGLGGIKLDYDTFKDDRDQFANYGGGIEYFVSEDIALRADVRGIYTFDDNYNNLAATIGVSFLLGGKGKAAGIAPTPGTYTPPPVTAEEGISPMGATSLKPAPFQILFDFNKSDIKPGLHDNFQQVADYLRSYKEIVLRIEGYTDSVGNKLYNQALSMRRAQSVSRYLSANFGVPQSQMYLIGYGEENPAADNATAAGRRLNRRAELKYMTPVAKPEELFFNTRFKFDKTDVNPALHDKYQKVADYLRTSQDFVLGIKGYTDTSGAAAYNQTLSLRRAESVGDYLSTQFNIPRSQIQVVGLGEQDPVANNATLKGRQLNRRADLVLFENAK